MECADDFVSARPGNDRERLARFLANVVYLVGVHGVPLYLGHSLIYHFAVATPLWAGAVAEVETPPPVSFGATHRGFLQYFLSPDIPKDKGLLDMGGHGEWSPMCQSYSGLVRHSGLEQDY